MVRAGLTVARLADAIERRTQSRLVARIIGDDSRTIASAAPLETARPDQLAFLANRRYRAAAASTRAGAIVLSADDRQHVFQAAPAGSTLIECDAPYAWFAYAAQELAPAQPEAAGISALAGVHSAASVDPSASVGAHAAIEAGATIGARAHVGAGAFVGRDARIGADTRIHPGAVVYAECEIGQRCIVHSGAVIGADGFGFAPFDGRWVKIPQTGRVLIGDDVEIGANTTIDRGTMGDTVIEDGCKLDNQIQIAHNCRIGAHTVIAGCVGIAGSATVGRGCQLGGAAMIAGHLSIADGSVIGGGTLVSRSISAPGYYSGSFPLMKHRDWERNAALLRHLDQLRDRIRSLEEQLQKKDCR
ncbi:MAG: UDP-3-O-(3-hydroxymyristoyl)glucosamine N-acyltransferase [Gemmatimonadota bacterium]